MITEIKRKKVITMTLYEINYKAKLNIMLDKMIQKFGCEHCRVIEFAEYVEKYYDRPSYENRKFIEGKFKSLMKNS
jgi:hypothetical protein